jgi:hypothetical protein
MDGKQKLLKQDVQDRVRTPVERREMLLAGVKRHLHDRWTAIKFGPHRKWLH